MGARSQSERVLRNFKGTGYDKGRPFAVQALWFAFSALIVTKWWCPTAVRVAILRAFGAEIGTGVLIRHRVRVHWPWKLRIGNDTWIGEDAWILNLESVDIGHDVCISQGAFVCTGSHDFDSPSFEFDNAPIVIGDGVWLAARCTILRGVRIGSNSLVGANALVTCDLAERSRVRAPRAVEVAARR
ncbi:DapH/DapD/GlmU-related protein [Prescottella equi]|uniref:DapH/DapD/GlmU-related protein n=1 Tax=Rhodococcus hoagii TaxID=43767 RepID=UPI000A0F8242|nr:DapH/DapD/GlmU-related protein [Prescottella equi]